MGTFGSVKVLSFGRPFGGLLARNVILGSNTGVDGSGKGIMTPSRVVRRCKISATELFMLFTTPPRESLR